MALSFIYTEKYRTKFYNRENDFKGFLELSEEQLSILTKKVYRKQEIMIDNLPPRQKTISKPERYKETLQYLTSQNTYFELETFDQRIAFLIMMTDPNLVTFKEFLKLDLIAMTEIDNVKA